MTEIRGIHGFGSAGVPGPLKGTQNSTVVPVPGALSMRHHPPES
jgi:hypothetical protein